MLPNFRLKLSSFTFWSFLAFTDVQCVKTGNVNEKMDVGYLNKINTRI